MFKNRFLLVIGVLSLLLVTMAVSRPLSKAPASNFEGANDFFQRHADWAHGVQVAVVPVTGNSESADYYRRHPELRASAAIVADTTADFYLRHPEWANRAADVTSSLAESLERPGLACESPVDCR